MDIILPQLLAFPPHPPPATPLSDAEYHKQMKALLETLNSVSASLLTSGVKGGGDLLDILDPSINTLPYLFSLIAHINNFSGKQKKDQISENFTPGGPLWIKMLNFVQNFDAIQSRYCGNEIRRLLDLTILSSRKANQPSLAVLPVQFIILRIDPSGRTLTSSHLSFVALCLEVRDFLSALPVLDSDIYFLAFGSDRQAEAATKPFSPFTCSKHDSSSTYITPTSGISAKLFSQDYLAYFLYGAMIYLGLKDWERAQFFLEVAVTCPTSNNASKIQIEAYKKLILVKLLRSGKSTTSVPRNTNAHTAKMYDSLAKPYIAFSKVFEESIEREQNSRRLVAEAQAGESIWFEDCNAGLVGQVIHAFRQFSVQHLEDTYAALTVADIARHTSPDPTGYEETGQYVIRLISSGLLNATICQTSADPQTWVVRFLGSSKEGNRIRSEEQQHEDVVQQTRKIKALMDYVREADRQLETSREYVQEASKAKKARMDGGGMDETIGSHYPIGFDQDEDMMAEL